MAVESSEVGNTFRIFDAESGEELQLLEGQQFFGFSSDGKKAVTSGDNNTARVWDLP